MEHHKTIYLYVFNETELEFKVQVLEDGYRIAVDGTLSEMTVMHLMRFDRNLPTVDVSGEFFINPQPRPREHFTECRSFIAVDEHEHPLDPRLEQSVYNWVFGSVQMYMTNHRLRPLRECIEARRPYLLQEVIYA